MRNVLENTGVTQRIEFRSSAGALPADVGSISYNFYGHTGSKIRGPVVMTAPAAATAISIPFPASDNSITSPHRFEKRTVVVTYASDGQSYTQTLTWRIIPLLPVWTTEDDVRALLGLNEDELLNDEIDLFSAYLRLEDELTAATLTTALTSGLQAETSANTLLAVEAAIALIPSLQLRTPMVQADGGKRYERFRSVPDWRRIAHDLSEMRATLVAAVTGVDLVEQPLAVFATPTDPVTGA